MYLLKPVAKQVKRLWCYYLHSTMYLLKRSFVMNQSTFDVFTFHYVSIKTHKYFDIYKRHHYLHSTMYLLKRAVSSLSSSLVLSFTFHYVSIKTYIFPDVKSFFITFTFHYVSIKTCHFLNLLFYQITFTFHYVSIKTIYLRIYCRSIFIYIPLCIY